MTRKDNEQVKEPAQKYIDGKGAWICPNKFPILCKDIEGCEFDCERMRRDTDQYP